MDRTMRMRAGSLVSAMTRPANTARKSTPGPVADKLAAEFARLAGAQAKALELVLALRNGDLAPTGPMGWMDVKISLVLVQDALTRAGLPTPTAEALDATLKSVLWMRAGGMGWGRIAFLTSNRPGRATGKGKPSPR